MSVLSHYFDSSVNQSSPTQIDVCRKISYSDGEEIITYVPVDYPALTASLGTVDDWSLNSLLKAGINPNFPISTGYGTRLEGLNDIQAFEDFADSLFEDETPIQD